MIQYLLFIKKLERDGLFFFDIKRRLAKSKILLYICTRKLQMASIEK